MHTNYSWVLMAVATMAWMGCGGNAPSGGGSGSGSGSSSRAAGASGDNSGSDNTGGAGEEEISTEGWGHLKGRFIVLDAPPPEKIKVTGDDVAYCGKFDIVDQSVVAGPDGGLSNVVLTLYVKRGAQPPTPHEQYAAAAGKTVTMNNMMCSFMPHVTLLRTDQTLEIKNSDEVGHNTNVAAQNHRINPLIAPNQAIEDTFEQAERLPAKVTCNIHPWMKGWLVVQETPYMAITNDAGEFLIENLPAGKHTIQVWHEPSNYVQDVEVNGKAARWQRGLVDVIIKNEDTADLGEVKIKYATPAGG